MCVRLLGCSKCNSERNSSRNTHNHDHIRGNRVDGRMVHCPKHGRCRTCRHAEPHWRLERHHCSAAQWLFPALQRLEYRCLPVRHSHFRFERHAGREPQHAVTGVDECDGRGATLSSRRMQVRTSERHAGKFYAGGSSLLFLHASLAAALDCIHLCIFWRVVVILSESLTCGR